MSNTSAVALTELVRELESGSRPKGGASDKDFEVLSIGGEHLDGDGRFRFESRKFVSRSFYSSMRRGRLQREDILIVKDGATTGKVAFLDDSVPLPAAINEHVFRITLNSDIVLPKYVFFYLLSPIGKADILKDFRGATVGGISQEFTEKVFVPMPKLSEQKRIVAILEKADRLRRMRRYAGELNDTFPQSVFLEMFGESNFERVALKELALSARNSFVNGPFGSDLLTSELTDSGVPVVYIRDISTGCYTPQSNVFVTAAKAANLEFCKVKAGDVLVTKVGDPPGVAAIYPLGEPDAVVTQDVIRIRPRIDIVEALYIQSFLNSSVGQRELSKIMVQGTRLRFSLGQFKEILVPLPPFRLQQKFGDVVRGFERLRAKQREAERQAEHLFQTLLHRAFRGEL